MPETAYAFGETLEFQISADERGARLSGGELRVSGIPQPDEPICAHWFGLSLHRDRSE